MNSISVVLKNKKTVNLDMSIFAIDEAKQMVNLTTIAKACGKKVNHWLENSTTKEYIEAWHGSDLDTLLAEGKVQGEERSFYSVIKDPTPEASHGGARYWSRIYKLEQGAGSQPDAKVTNIQDDEDASPVVGGFTPVDDTHGAMPQTRYDWDTTLERYRSILYGEGIGSVPQE